jgi:hypothetical protein
MMDELGKSMPVSEGMINAEQKGFAINVLFPLFFI